MDASRKPSAPARGGGGFAGGGASSYYKKGVTAMNPASMAKSLGLTSTAQTLECEFLIQKQQRREEEQRQEQARVRGGLGGDGGGGGGGGSSSRTSPSPLPMSAGRGVASDVKMLQRRREIMAATRNSSPNGKHTSGKHTSTSIKKTVARVGIATMYKAAMAPATPAAHMEASSSLFLHPPSPPPPSSASPPPRSQPLSWHAAQLADDNDDDAPRPTFAYFPPPSCLADVVGNARARDTIDAWLCPRNRNPKSDGDNNNTYNPTSGGNGAYKRRRSDASYSGILLLYGPPGVGKTLTLNLLAAKHGYVVNTYDPCDFTNISELFQSLLLALNRPRMLTVVDPFEGMPRFTTQKCAHETTPDDIAKTLKQLNMQATARAGRLILVVSSDRAPLWHTARHALPPAARVSMSPMSTKQMWFRYRALTKSHPCLRSLSDRVAQYAAVANGDMRQFESMLYLETTFDAHRLPVPHMTRFTLAETILSPYVPLDPLITYIEDGTANEDLQTRSMTFENYFAALDNSADPATSLASIADAADRISLSDTLSPHGPSSFDGSNIVGACWALSAIMFHTAPRIAARTHRGAMQPFHARYGELAAHVYNCTKIPHKRFDKKVELEKMRRCPSDYSTAARLEAEGLSLTSDLTHF